jgi:hypothetical protein
VGPIAPNWLRAYIYRGRWRITWRRYRYAKQCPGCQSTKDASRDGAAVTSMRWGRDGSNRQRCGDQENANCLSQGRPSETEYLITIVIPDPLTGY